jgi:hypothetical protein
VSGPVSAGKVSVSLLPMHPGAEMLDQDGKQIWYADDDGLGSATVVEIGHMFTGELNFGYVDDGADGHDGGPTG